MRSQRKGRGFESRCLHLTSENSVNFLLQSFFRSAIIPFVRKHSSAGMSVRLTRERSWVRAPLLPLKKTSYGSEELAGARFFAVHFSVFSRRPSRRAGLRARTGAARLALRAKQALHLKTGGRKPARRSPTLRFSHRCPPDSSDRSGVWSWRCTPLSRDSPGGGRNHFPPPGGSASTKPSPPSWDP